MEVTFHSRIADSRTGLKTGCTKTVLHSFNRWKAGVAGSNSRRI